MKSINRGICALTAAFLCCGSLAACGQKQETETGLWENIEPLTEDEINTPKTDDGVYLSYTRKEPAENPYAGDTKVVKEKEEKDGILFCVYEKHAEIIGHTDDFAETVYELPAELDGKPVTAVADVTVNEDSIFDIDKNGAFYGCYSLEKVVVPEGYYSIGQYGFYGCKNLKTVEMPETISAIGSRAFAMCSQLRNMTVPEGVAAIGDSAFSLTPWYDNLLYHNDLVIFNCNLYDVGKRCTGEVTIPDYVTSVGDYAFYSCRSVQSVIVPESVESIGAYAFCNCPGLKYVAVSNQECKIAEGETTFSNKADDDNKDYYNGIIYGVPGSSSEAFAKKYGYHFEDIKKMDTRTKEQETEPVVTTTEETAKVDETTTAS
ncbi:MAG: leucine-rich repeat domain-containing protein [Oscillospiraceae bacterium]|nr:leucine-rich repeat domain-containing protein [Oscillospiraceae bacterium]